MIVSNIIIETIQNINRMLRTGYDIIIDNTVIFIILL